MVIMVIGDFISPTGKPFQKPRENVFAFSQFPNMPGLSRMPRNNRKAMKKIARAFIEKANGPTSYFVRWGVFGETEQELKAGMDALFSSVKAWQHIRIHTKDDMSDVVRIERMPRRVTTKEFGPMARQIQEAGFDVTYSPLKVTQFIEGIFSHAQSPTPSVAAV